MVSGFNVECRIDGCVSISFHEYTRPGVLELLVSGIPDEVKEKSGGLCKETWRIHNLH